jgi:phosphate starvation-inducible protein PhoH
MASTRKLKSAALLQEMHHVSNGTHEEEYHPHSKEGIAAAKKTNALTIKLDHMITIKALTPNQQSFFDAYNAGYYCMMLYGSAGTGKSFISIYKALEDVLSKDTPYDKLVIVRSAVSSRDIGFLPGDADEKMEMYELPYVQICNDLFNRKDAYQRLKEQGKIEFISSSFLRGLTFNRAIVVADEIQNTTYGEQFTLMTRVGQDSKLMMLGDYRQNDLVKSKYDISGLGKFHNILRHMKEFTDIQFTTDDICRSSMVKNFIISAEKWEMENES